MSIRLSYKPAAVRAFYLALSLDIFMSLSLAVRLDYRLNCIIDLHPTITLDRSLNNLLSLACEQFLNLDINSHPVSVYNLSSILDLNSIQDHQLKHYLQLLIDQLPNTLDDQEDFNQWRSTHSEQWIEDLRHIMIIHRNIGYDWQLTTEQRELLREYYSANLLLVQCLNSGCCVSRDVRESIEETLLLPMEELRMRNVEVRE